jgi:Ribosomal protein S19
MLTMSRSLKKGPFCHPKLLKKALQSKQSGSKVPIKLGVELV